MGTLPKKIPNRAANRAASNPPRDRIWHTKDMAHKKFKSEVSQLLHLITHSLYSHREIFIRELVSNASDALDKLKYLTLTQDEYARLEFSPRVDISFDHHKHTWLSVRDNGIGMSEEELEQQLGTIAHSGTRSFLSEMKEAPKSTDLIGQFGVGFYSVFMVAKEVRVTSRRAGSDEAFCWKSDGLGTFTIEKAAKDGVGTEIVLDLKDDAQEFAHRYQIEEVVKRYSDHISFPIYLTYNKEEFDEKGAPKSSTEVTEQINNASALWKRSRGELKDKDYESFYKSITHDTEPPLFHLHLQAEGTLEYAALLYVPQKTPFGIHYSDFKPEVRLYIRRVFITDDFKKLLPPYLRFLRGVIDSEDLPLNVSRELLQENRVLMQIRTTLVKRFLNEVGELSAKKPQVFLNFIQNYNRVLKEGVYQDFTNRDQLIEIIRFHSTKAEHYTSLGEYKSRMRPNQKHIYYLAGSELETLRNSPLLERFRAKDIEVVLLGDEIDEIIMPSIATYKELALTPINQKSEKKDDLVDERDEELERGLKPLLAKIKAVVGTSVKEVTFSARLDTSPACIVLDKDEPTLRIRELLRGVGEGADAGDNPKPILELNPRHSVIQSLNTIGDTDLFNDMCWLLVEQSFLIENIPIKNAADFTARINRITERALQNNTPPNTSHTTPHNTTKTK